MVGDVHHRTRSGLGVGLQRIYNHEMADARQLVKKLETQTRYKFDRNVVREWQQLQQTTDLCADAIVRYPLVSKTQDECSHTLCYTTLFKFFA
jgi:hypothetical protein